MSSLIPEKKRKSRPISSGTNGKIAPTDNVKERHAQFAAAMDSLPDNVWGTAKIVDRLAATLHWKRSEIALHAYMYMAALVDAEEVEYSDGKESEKQHSQTSKLSSWTPEEIRLLQTLLATYAGTDCAQSSISMRISRLFPQKTESQVQRQISILVNASERRPAPGAKKSAP
eukprot:scaffold1475_cov167-Amphora_coffeaeformis.AAC.11